MKYFTCCCAWSYVIGKHHVYGAIWPMGIGTYPDALSNSQRMMTREQFADLYADCWACWKGKHQHAAAGPAVECSTRNQERTGDKV